MKSLVRDLGFISWKDELANFEDIKSEEFKNSVELQKYFYKEAYNNVDSSLQKAWIKLFNALPKRYPPYYSFRWAGHTIVVSQQNRYIPSLYIEVMDGTKIHLEDVRAYGTDSELFWCIKDDSDGREKLSLTIYTNNFRRSVAIYNVGDTAAASDNEVYYTGATDIFWFNKILCVGAKGNRVIYEEEEEKYILSLLKPKGQDEIFVLRKSALNQDIGLVNIDRVRWLVKGFGRKLPITSKSIAFDTYFTIEKNKIYYPSGLYLVDVYSRDEKPIFIFSKDATQGLYIYSRNNWIPIIKMQVCDLKFSDSTEDIIMGVPNAPDRVINLNKSFIPIISTELQGPRFRLESGNEPLPWFAVFPDKKPIGIIICGYGSYGMSIRKQQMRMFIPWLQRNFVVASICVRGGSENGDYWWDSSRTAQRRHIGVRDMIVGTQLMQRKFGFDKTNTIIYGRSAGGFLVTAAMRQLIDKIAVVYAAKPYTDLLRTTTNRNARQTVQEKDEFGLVETQEQLVDFVTLAGISPYENVNFPPKVYPLVLLTAGTNDSEVPASMPLRYATRLQVFSWKTAICRVEKEGHFTSSDKEIGEAKDGAICESYIQQRSELGYFDEASEAHN
jgi:hypothetical protein